MPAAAEPRNSKSRSKSRRRGSSDVLEVQLDSARNQHLVWVGIGVLAGTVMIWRLGIIAQWVGAGLIAAAVLRAYKLIRAFLRPPGTFRVDKTTIGTAAGDLLRAATNLRSQRSSNTLFFSAEQLDLAKVAPNWSSKWAIKPMYIRESGFNPKPSNINWQRQSVNAFHPPRQPTHSQPSPGPPDTWTPTEEHR